MEALSAEETAERGRVERKEAVQRKQLLTQLSNKGGVEYTASRRRKQADNDVLDLKQQIAEQSDRIRALKKSHGPDDPATIEAVERMAELRARLPVKVKRVFDDDAASKRSTPSFSPPPPSSVDPDQPLWLVSSATPLNPMLRSRTCPCSAPLIAAVLRGEDPTLPTGDGGDCPACRFNLATLLLTNGHPKVELFEAVEGLDEVPLPHVLLLRGMAVELRDGPKEAQGLYLKALSEDPSLALSYFGFLPDDLPKVSHALAIFHDLRIGDRVADGLQAKEVQVKAVGQLLRYVEFGKIPLPEYPPLEDHSERLSRDLHCCVRHFLPPPVRLLLDDHYKELITNGLLTFGDRRTGRYYAYNDPVGRLVMAQYTPFMEKLTGHRLKPSYSYLISYRDVSELAPHQDREQAEFVVSMQLSISPEYDVWPLYVGAEPQPRIRGDKPKPPREQWRKHIMYNGDAVVFRGRELIHWRDPLPSGCEATMLLIHYVFADYEGPLKTGFNE
eukprot:Sspe_Gene.17840::Locus_6370_Transcript_1_1_Confidence_1.000_Length_1881::g.17840::m.17840